MVGPVLFFVLAIAPAEGTVPAPPSSSPGVVAPAPAAELEEAADSTTEAVAPTPASPTTPDQVMEAARARKAAEGNTAPPAPEPASGSAPYEMSGFMDRPVPAAPGGRAVEEDGGSEEPSAGKLVWGVHRPVAKWKRSGLIGSGVVTGVAFAIAIGTGIEGNRRLNEISRYIEGTEYEGLNPIVACRENMMDTGGAEVLVANVGLAHKCQRFDGVRVTRNVSIGLGVVGILSTVTFGILHLVHREEEPRRVEARSDGFAVRF